MGVCLSFSAGANMTVLKPTVLCLDYLWQEVSLHSHLLQLQIECFSSPFWLLLSMLSLL